jgi:hypothetical protein
LVGALLLPLWSHAGWSQATVVPLAGQTTEQTGQDRAACEGQATAQTGYHPSQPPPTVQPARPVAGQRVAGAARGAAAGAVRTQQTDKEDREIDDVTGAAARAGAVAGASRQRQERRQTAAQAQRQQQDLSQRQAAYNQAFVACLSAKGYQVQ